MIRDAEIKTGMKKLRGEIPSGKVYNPDGTEYHEDNFFWGTSTGQASGPTSQPGRDDGWRINQSQKSLKDILRGI